MKTLYIECNMGAAGDMLTAALYELLPEHRKAAFLNMANSLFPGRVIVSADPSVKCGIAGTHMTVKIDGAEELEHDHNHDHGDHVHDGHGHCGHHHAHDHAHSSLHDIEHIIDHFDIPGSDADHAVEVYKLIADAESHAHGVPVEQVHFHEVGDLDAICDVVNVCWLMGEISPEQVIVSPIHVGSGNVKTSHGILPVPAPATARILRGFPTYEGNVKGELCTPTGAALLRHFGTSFGPKPAMTASAIGYGCGTKDFEQANVVRVFLGETTENLAVELKCDIDDMSPEYLAFACDRLTEAGALDVLVTTAHMKKNRVAYMLTVLCRPEDKDRMLELIFQHTSTIGIREAICERYILERRIETRETEFGPVRVKISEGYGAKREKWEFEDLAKISLETGISIDAILERINK